MLEASVCECLCACVLGENGASSGALGALTQKTRKYSKAKRVNS